MAEMADAGYGAMTIESIARRAGVSKATIYRQWDGKLDLVASALDTVKDDLRLDADAPIRDQISTLLTWLATFVATSDQPAAACLPSLVSAAQYDEAVREFHHRFSRQRKQVLVDLIAQGVETGRLPGHLDPELTAELLVGPIFYRRLMSDRPFDTDHVPALMTAVLG